MNKAATGKNEEVIGVRISMKLDALACSGDGRGEKTQSRGK